ncbi:hypothetical protein [Streptomyces sp. NPDC020681]
MTTSAYLEIAVHAAQFLGAAMTLLSTVLTYRSRRRPRDDQDGDQ